MRRLPELPWEPFDVGSNAVREKWRGPEKGGVDIRLPPGCEFVDPQPAVTNHFSNVFVFHQASGVVHNDDCLCYFDSPLRKMGVLMSATSIRHDQLSFHTSYPSALTDPAAFRSWAQEMVRDWAPFDVLCTAHNGVLKEGASARLQRLLDESESEFEKLTEALKLDAAAGGRRAGSPPVSSPDIFCECG